MGNYTLLIKPLILPTVQQLFLTAMMRYSILYLVISLAVVGIREPGDERNFKIP